MKSIPTKADIEKILLGNFPNKPKIKLKNDGCSAILAAFYISFMKSLAEDTDRLLYIDDKSILKERHLIAAAKKVIGNCSYGQLIRNKVKETVDEPSSTLSDDDDEEEDDEEEET